MPDLSQSRDWLTLLLYGLDLIANPSPAKLVESFESWNYRHCLRPQLRRLERLRLLERGERGSGVPYRLTATGRLAAQGGVDPPRRWKRAWDGQWRVLLFDLPSRERLARLRLWRWLRAHRFGYLQNSVWLSPDPPEESILPLRHLNLTPESFAVLASRPEAPNSDIDLVKSAWDFPLINRCYQRVLDLAVRGLELANTPDAKPAQLRAWLANEREAWLAALARDPLLPEALLPPDYLGCAAWEQRRVAFTALTRRLAKQGPSL